MRYTALLALLCLGAIFGADAQAQDCGQVLQQGIWESHDFSAGTVQSSSFANWACSSGSSRLSGSYLGDYGDFKLNKEDDSSSCSSSSGSWKIEQQQIEKTRAAAEALVQAWSACIGSLGSHASILYRDDLSNFTIQLSTRGVQNNHGRAVLKPLEPAKITCTEALGHDHEIDFNTSKTISCSRSATDPVTIDVEYPDGYGGQSLYVRGYKPQIVPPPRPTIVSVAVPINSSDQNSLPLRDNKWSVTFPAPIEQGIAFILDQNEFQIDPAQQPFALCMIM
jgi:hypothetical protein